MVAKDYFSKIPIAILMIAVNRLTMWPFMIRIIGHMGPYKGVLVDPGRFIARNAFGDFLNMLEVERQATTGYHTEANGFCGCIVLTFQQSLAKRGANGKNWFFKVKRNIKGYNRSWHSTIGCTPLYCHKNGKKTQKFEKGLGRCCKIQRKLSKRGNNP
jgi:hypothetical protein